MDALIIILCGLYTLKQKLRKSLIKLIRQIAKALCRKLDISTALDWYFRGVRA